MKKKLLAGFMTILLLVLSSLMACTTSTTTSSQTSSPPAPLTTSPSATSPVVSSPTSSTPTAHWWDKFGEPKYGGTLTVQTAFLNPNFDPTYAGPFAGPLQQYESLFQEDWTLDREIWPFSGSYVPDKYYVGCLAKDWEMPDPQTMVVHLRQGIHWQNMPPVNGRELTASDIVYQYDRMFGLGNGFDKPSPYWLTQSSYVEKVTAQDKYTVVISFKNPSALNSWVMFAPGQYNWIAPPEAVEQSKDGLITNWKIAAGTGPWEISDFVSGTSVTFNKNPDYWGHDERYPENRLPYTDTLKILCIPDMATALSALRTGKIDLLANIPWQQAKNVSKTNPELQQAKLPAAGDTVDLRCDKSPFTDIRVREALQMAIDPETIASTYYGGTVTGKPAGLVSPDYNGWCIPYDEWPQELKDEYSYNPSGAKQLLAEAGYPNGFKTDVIAPSDSDLDLLQIIKSYFSDVGVDMKINVMDPATFAPFAISGKQDAMTFSAKTGVTFEPWVSLDYRSRIPTNYSFNKDATYDAMILSFQTAPNMNDLKQLVIKADMYALAKHWGVQVCPAATYTIYEPNLKGYSGENLMRSYMYYARWWKDD